MQCCLSEETRQWFTPAPCRQSVIICWQCLQTDKSLFFPLLSDVYKLFTYLPTYLLTYLITYFILATWTTPETTEDDSHGAAVVTLLQDLVHR